MIDNIIFKAYRRLKEFVVYKPPAMPTPFVLDEVAEDKGINVKPTPNKGLHDAAKQLEKLLNYARDLQNTMEKAATAFANKQDKQTLANLEQELNNLEKRKVEITPLHLGFDSALAPLEELVSLSLDQNEHLLKELYSLPENKDALFRHFEIAVSPPIKALLVFLDGMVDKKVITDSILRPLLMLPTIPALKNTSMDMDKIFKALEEHLPNNEIIQVIDFATIASGINSGDTALFIEGANTALIIGTKGFPVRSVGTPKIEQSVRGSQVAFTENLRANTGLIRSILPTNELVTEIMDIGNRAPLKCALMYIKPIANPQLVKEVKRRLTSIQADYITDIGMIEQFIEDYSTTLFPQMLSTERPDRVAPHLVEGRIAIVYNGSPFVHVLPINFFTFFHSAEDFSLKLPAGSFMRVLRLLAALMSVTLPPIYLAINYFHPEALPTELALAIAGAREAVPFPALFEIFLMELSFELIREAGLRIPGILGSTIGIVGAIILGQAAVAANIVSPIMVIVIAITGLSSFAISDYRLSFSLRTMRFAFIILSAVFGLVGLATGLLITTVILCNMKSFGMPYLAPIAPKTVANLDVVFRGSVFLQEKRPDPLNTQDRHRQPPISRPWIKEDPIGKKDDDA